MLLRRGLLTRRGAVIDGGARPRAATYNAAAPFVTPTYDGSGETTHPDILDFGETGWNGWRYWMAHTPFPASDNDFENPSILVSADGLTWTEPAGITNPVVPLPDHANSYNSDCEIVHDPGADRVYLFYRYYDSQHATEKYQTRVCWSTDGITWTGHQQCMAGNNVWFRLSPGVVLEGGVWKMWVVERYWNPNTVELYTTTDPLSWGDHSTAVVCDVPIPAGRDPWHLDVIKHGGVYYMTLNTVTADTDGQEGALHLATSLDGLTWRVSEALLEPPASGWDSNRVYRGTSIIDGDTLRLWYSVMSDANAWRLGYTEIPLSEAPVPG